MTMLVKEILLRILFITPFLNNSYSDGSTGLNSGVDYFTYEFDSYNDVIDLLDKKQGNQVISRGTYKELKNQCPDLKLSNVVYLYSASEQQVYKLGVGGGSLSNLWAYCGGFGNNDTTLRYVTKISSQEAENDRGFKYMQLTFEKVKEAENWQVIWNELQKLGTIISSSANKKAELLGNPQRQISPNDPFFGNAPQKNNASQAPQLPTINVDDEIDINDIPF